MAFKLITLVMVITACIIMQVQADPSKNFGEKVAIFVKNSKNGELRFLGAQDVDQWITNKQNWLEQLRPVSEVDYGDLIADNGNYIVTYTDNQQGQGVYYDDFVGNNKPIIINLSGLNGGNSGGNGGSVSNGNAALVAAINASPIESLLPQIIAQAALQQRRRVPNRRRRRPNKQYYLVRAHAQLQ